MKLLTSRIKKWDFNQRLEEINNRLENVLEDVEIKEETREQLSEALQIVHYWMNHMKSDKTVKNKKRKKNVNLWDEI